jgi:UrcA family protein
MPCAKSAINASSSNVTLFLTWRHSRSPDYRRSDMTISTLRFGFPLAIALATVSAAAFAEQADQTPNVKIEAGKVRQTEVRVDYTGIPVEQLQVDRTVSYGDLDLTTPSGAAELNRRITEAAKEDCEQLDTADPLDLSDTDDNSCVRAATDGALKQAKAAIVAARTNSATRATT